MAMERVVELAAVPEFEYLAEVSHLAEVRMIVFAKVVNAGQTVEATDAVVQEVYADISYSVGHCHETNAQLHRPVKVGTLELWEFHL